ncbi:unnamed protein product [[Candida] boidinii]|nr:unnamed protein product [[Candida] boidinii]
MTSNTTIKTSSTNNEPATLKLTGEVEKLSIDEQVRRIVTSDQFNAHSAGSRGYEIGKTGPDPEGLKILPEAAKKRFEEFGVDVSAGYPERPEIKEIPKLETSPTKLVPKLLVFNYLI